MKQLEPLLVAKMVVKWPKVVTCGWVVIMGVCMILIWWYELGKISFKMDGDDFLVQSDSRTKNYHIDQAIVGEFRRYRTSLPSS